LLGRHGGTFFLVDSCWGTKTLIESTQTNCHSIFCLSNANRVKVLNRSSENMAMAGVGRPRRIRCLHIELAAIFQLGVHAPFYVRLFLAHLGLSRSYK